MSCEHFKDGKCEHFCDDDHGSDVYMDHCHLHNEAICYLKQCPLYEGNPWETEDKCPQCGTNLDYCGDAIKKSGYWYCHKCNRYIQDPNGYGDLNKVTEEELAFCQTLRYSEKIDKLEKRKENEK
jgi:hypothetical protein